MSGQIFISYRRDDASYPAGRLYDRLLVRLPNSHIFIDVDLEPGIDFVEAIEASVGSCDVLIAVIGNGWLPSSDDGGKRRLDNPDDFVRLEIATALKRNIRVIPVLVDAASMPRPNDLPDDLKLLARRNALEVSHNRFNADFARLVAAIEKVLEKADTEHKQSKESLNPTPTSEGEAVASFNRGLAHHNERDYDKAISDYTEAIRLIPNYEDAYYNRGISYGEKKMYDKAISDYTEAIRLDPNNSWAYNNRGITYFAQKEYDKAIRDYKEAIRLDSNSNLAYNNRVERLQKKGKLDRAKADFAKSEELKKA